MNSTYKCLKLGLLSISIGGCFSVNMASAEVDYHDVITPLPRTIITTDPELDDLNSMLRTLLYSNEIKISGLVVSSSRFHYSGDKSLGIDPYRWYSASGKSHIEIAIDAYSKVYNNLKNHDKNYPSPQSLTELYRLGNIKNVGDMLDDTSGSDLIKQVLLDDQDGLVFLQAWGGLNTIARALASIQTEYGTSPDWPHIHEKVSKKAVITSFGLQDSTYNEYIKPNWPDIQTREVSTNIWGYFARNTVLPEDKIYLSKDWIQANVSSITPMGSEYRVWGDGKQMAAGFDDEDYFGLSNLSKEQLEDKGYKVWMPPQEKGSFISEGDSSNFAILINNGLDSWADPKWGGWGGRQSVDPTDSSHWSNANSKDMAPDGSYPDDYAASRWWGDIQRDFSARLQWSIRSSFAEANHAPTIKIKEGNRVGAHQGDIVKLTPITSDPDGNSVSTVLWYYKEASIYSGSIEIKTHDTGQWTFTIPEDAKVGDTLHIIAESQDDGSPSMTRYQRIIVTVK
jgi:hypothetical protein